MYWTYIKSPFGSEWLDTICKFSNRRDRHILENQKCKQLGESSKACFTTKVEYSYNYGYCNSDILK